MENTHLMINSREFPRPADQRPLLWYLRDSAGLTGTKYGCGIGVCGACTVHVGDQPVRACVTPAASVQQEITTIEQALRTPLGGQVLQAWLAEDVAQCGYCQPGQMMSAIALLRRQPNPSDEEITEAMNGNLCRCGTYLRIRRAIRRVSRRTS